MNINRVIIIANTTRDVELKSTPSGTSVANFSIASNRKYKAGDEWKEEVSYFDCVVWGNLAELCEKYVKKGDRVGIEGRLQQRRWETDGKKSSKVEIVVENIQFLSNKGNSQDDDAIGVVSKSISGLSDKSSNIGDSNPFSDDEIPF